LFFGSYKDAEAHIGRNVIEIDLSDIEGALTTYTVAIAVYKSSEKVEIDEDTEFKFNGFDQKGDMKV
jgi:hypothetical protein